jgi:asparagine synthase (glutamine-hydrolysing)
MCGILYYRGDKQSDQNFKKAASLMNHRGPDNLSTFKHNNHKLGHNRLSIIDLDKRSNQPFISGDHVLIFNGEIFNYKELIKEHQLQVKTSSDTEVLLQLFIKYQEKCLEYLNGMFAFIILNTRTNALFVARDRLGIKPMYIYNHNSELIIASEIAAIKSLVNLKPNKFGLRQYSKLRMTVNNDTVYENVSFFPAGNFMQNNVINPYWTLNIEEDKPHDDEKLQWLIEDAIKLRMRSDVPVSTYLSGGLDSTIITALAKPDASWTIGFDTLNEFEWSSLAGSRLGIDCHQLYVGYEEYKTTAKWMIEKRQEPLSVPNEVLIYIMTKKARELGYKVILSGEGADELFWGYDRIFKWAKEQKELTVEGFDSMYCYGSVKDNEVVDYALSTQKSGTPLQKIAHYFQLTHLHGLLRRVDNSTMLCSVEARVPFVDHRLVEYMNGQSFEYKMGNSFKEPLKRIFKNIVPHEIIERPKMGFPVPLDKVFETETLAQGWDEWFKFNLNNVTW